MFHALAARCRGPSAPPQVLPPGHEAEYFTPGIGHGMFRYSSSTCVRALGLRLQLHVSCCALQRLLIHGVGVVVCCCCHDHGSSLNGFKIGMLICYDAEFPELARLLARAGADLILVPTASGQVEPARSPRAVPVLPALGATHVPRARPCCRARMPPVGRQ